MAATGTRRRVRARVTGTVQGVGFRPFVYRLAQEGGLAGWVLNDVDGVLLEVTSYTTPCRTIMRAFKDGAHGRISQALYPGWSRVYTRVLAEGVIAAGAAVRVLEPAQAAEDVAATG